MGSYWDFKLIDDTNVLLRTPRQQNMYSIYLNNIVSHNDLTCLVAKASADECTTPAIGFLKPFGCHVMILNTFDNLGKFDAKGDEESKAIEKGAGPNWLFDIDYLTNSMNYMPVVVAVVVAGTNSTNFLGTKDAASQEVKKDVSSLRYIALPNWVHDALLESPSNTCKSDDPESSGNPNPTASTSNPPADQIETLTVETPIPTVSSPVPTACFEDSPEPSSTTRIISKRVTSQDVTPSLDNISTLANRFDDILGVTTSTVDSHREEADNLRRSLMLSKTQAGWKLCRKNFFNSKSRMFGLWFCPEGVRPIGTKWVLKKDERGIDSEFSARVYKVEKAMGTIDQTLFIKRKRGDFILIQVYVDDIIFGSSNPQICREFKALMHEKFQMSAMGELNFFLGLQVLQKKDDIFLSQDKYVGDILKKFGYSDVRSANTPMDKENP
nr:putative ribonuclease H-like domain-containing protein [Tanacetum cinerariifolium]